MVYLPKGWQYTSGAEEACQFFAIFMKQKVALEKNVPDQNFLVGEKWPNPRGPGVAPGDIGSCDHIFPSYRMRATSLNCGGTDAKPLGSALV